jgi:uncharacterized protein YlxW (UPF0749 family)
VAYLIGFLLGFVLATGVLRGLDHYHVQLLTIENKSLQRQVATLRAQVASLRAQVDDIGELEDLWPGMDNVPYGRDMFAQFPIVGAPSDPQP